MIFFLQDQDYISRLHAGCLVSFAAKGYFLAVLHAFVHVHLQNLHLLHNLLALTFFAAVFLTNNFTWSGLKETKRVKRGLPSNVSHHWPLTFSVTISTHRLHLLDHSRRQLSDHDAHAAPPTRCALLHGPRLPSLSAGTRKEMRKSTRST